MNTVTITGLKKTYRDLTAVNGVSLSIRQGAAFGILGPNGAGKSTLMNCLLGLLPYESGEVKFEEQHTIKKWNQYIGYVPQELAIYPELTPAENVRFFGSLYGVKGTELEKRVEWALEFVGLADVRDKKAGEFSGGMKRRLNLACAVVHNPRLIIMDEPTVGIDPQSRNRILENVRELNKKGVTIIYTTHYMPEVEEICDEIAVIDHGEVIAGGTKQQIMNMMGNDEVLAIWFTEDTGKLRLFLEETKKLEMVTRVEKCEDAQCRIYYNRSAGMIEWIISLSVRYGLEIQNIVNEEPKLEEIFLKLTGKTLRDEQ